MRFHDFGSSLRLAFHVACGFIFARAEFVREVPYDPSLLWLFFGEESTSKFIFDRFLSAPH
jgi:hypothetical protein